MIAMIAEFATSCRTSGRSNSGCRRRRTCRRSASRDLVASRLECRSEIWNAFGQLLVARPPGSSRRPARPRAPSRTSLPLSACLSAAVMRVPDSKSMPKLIPSRRARARRRAGSRPTREEPLRRAHVVQPHPLALRVDTERRRAGELPRPAHRAQHRLRRQHRGEQRDDDPDAQGKGEALVVVANTDSAVIRSGGEPLQSRLVGHHGSLTPAEMLVPLYTIR